MSYLRSHARRVGCMAFIISSIAIAVAIVVHNTSWPTPARVNANPDIETKDLNRPAVQVVEQKRADDSYTYHILRTPESDAVGTQIEFCSSSRPLDFQSYDIWQNGVVLLQAVASSGAELTIELSDHIVAETCGYWRPITGRRGTVFLAAINRSGLVVDFQWGNLGQSAPLGSDSCIQWVSELPATNSTIDVQRQNEERRATNSPVTTVYRYEQAGARRPLFTVDGSIDFAYPALEDGIVILGQQFGDRSLRVDDRLVVPGEDGVTALDVRNYVACWVPEKGVQWLTVLGPSEYTSDCAYAASVKKDGKTLVVSTFLNAQFGSANVRPWSAPPIMAIELNSEGAITSTKIVGYGCVSVDFTALVRSDIVFRTKDFTHAAFVDMSGRKRDLEGTFLIGTKGAS